VHIIYQQIEKNIIDVKNINISMKILYHFIDKFDNGQYNNLDEHFKIFFPSKKVDNRV
jgi:hypothetical protein